jgi:L-aminopeptidase/D-esterase-like protein
MKTLILLSLLALAGCANMKPATPPPVIVDKAVGVNCIKEKPVRPDYATERLTAANSDLEYGDALAGDWVLSRKYEGTLEAAVTACLK